jgi:hypothetical protein
MTFASICVGAVVTLGAAVMQHLGPEVRAVFGLRPVSDPTRPTSLAESEAGIAVSWQALPEDLRIPEGTGRKLADVRLQPTGWPLVVSNSPERITGSSKLVVLCRTRLDLERFRVFLHHQNATKSRMEIGLVLTNRSSHRINVYLERNSQLLPTEVQLNTNVDPAAAGRVALANWLTSRTTPVGAPGRDWYMATLGPEQSYYLTQPVKSRAGRFETVTGLYDLAVAFEDQRVTARPALEVVVLAHRGRRPSQAALDHLPVDAPDAPVFRRCRGVFRHGDRRGEVDYTVDGSQSVRWLDLSGPSTGPYNHSLAGEYELGDDGTGVQSMNFGNYGVLYNLDVTLRNRLSQPVQITCLLNTAGGRGSSVLTVDGECRLGPPVIEEHGSWIYKETMLGPREVKTFRLQFSLPGGSSGAHRLFFWPANTPSALRQ